MILDRYYERRRNPALCWLMTAVTNLFYRIEIQGFLDFPRQKAIILAPKHASMIDPFVCTVAWFKLVGHRHATWYFAKEEMFRFRPLAWYMSALGTFPIQRGKADRRALRFALDLLQHGSVLMIFPEGTRSRAILNAKSGLGYLACLTKTPVKPMRVYGLEGWKRFVPRRKIIVRFGECLSPDDESREVFTKRVMEAMSRL